MFLCDDAYVFKQAASISKPKLNPPAPQNKSTALNMFSPLFNLIIAKICFINLLPKAIYVFLIKNVDTFKKLHTNTITFIFYKSFESVSAA